jgi:hypothetical protein
VILPLRQTAALFLLALWPASAHAADSGQLFLRTSTMLGSEIPKTDSEKLSVAVSTDGWNWQRLFKKPTLTNFSRDASIIRRGQEYIVVYTDAFNSTNGTFGLARSTNLIEWTANKVTLTGPVMSNTPNNTWAPEWFVDDGKYYVLVRSGQKDLTASHPNYAPPGLGYLECHDPGTWTNWSDFALLEGPKSNENDPFILKVGSTYHLFTDDGGPGTGHILHRRSTTSAFQGYGAPTLISTNFRQTPALTNSGAWWQATPFEGQLVVLLGGDRFRLYFQATWWDQCFAVESVDGMRTWDLSTLQPLVYDGYPGLGHGSVMLLDASNALVPISAMARRADHAVTEIQTIQSNPSAYNLYTATDLTNSRSAGRADVTSNPTNYGLYTPQMITDMNLGGVTLQKTGSNAVVSLQLQSTPDLSMSFTNHGAPVEIEVDLPGNKHFLRLRALGPQ